MIPEFICMTTAWGGRDLTALQAAIPDLRLCVDEAHDAMQNFLASMRMTNNPCVHLEDDAVLCDGFYEKVIAAVNQYPNTVINFFSLRKTDYRHTEPFVVPGYRYMANVCFYIPARMGPALANYWYRWRRKSEHPTGYDLMMADFLKEHGLSYIQWMPHLVNHKVAKSLIDPRRSSQRIDKLSNIETL